MMKLICMTVVLSKWRIQNYLSDRVVLAECMIKQWTPSHVYRELMAAILYWWQCEGDSQRPHWETDMVAQGSQKWERLGSLGNQNSDRDG